MLQNHCVCVMKKRILAIFVQVFVIKIMAFKLQIQEGELKNMSMDAKGNKWRHKWQTGPLLCLGFLQNISNFICFLNCELLILIFKLLI